MEKLIVATTVAFVSVFAFARGTKMEGVTLAPAKYWAQTDSGVIASVYTTFLADGKTDNFIEANVSGSYIMADLGSPRRIRQLVVGTRNNPDCFSRLNNFKVAGSNDGVTWTVLHEETANDFGSGELIYIDVDAAKVGSFRYVKFYNFKGSTQTGDITEAAVYTDEAVMCSKQASPWGTAVDADEYADGVKVSLRLVSTNAAETGTAVAFASQTDYGADYAAWVAALSKDGKEKAVSADLGTVTTTAYTDGYIAGCTGNGRWYWNAFADLGNGCRAVADHGEFAIGSTVVHPLGYAANADVYKVYDGKTSADKDGEGWIVFDLGDIPAGKHIDLLRFWPRQSLEYRTTKLVIDFGYAASAPAWNVTGWQSPEDSTRPVKAVSAVPGEITWTTSVEPIICSAYCPIPMPTAVYFHSDTVKSKPRYLRVRSSSDHFNFGEVELRIADDPDDTVKFTQTATPRLVGTPSPAYGDGLIASGEPATVTMASGEVVTADGREAYFLDGFTLVVTNQSGVVSVSNAADRVCTFLPQAKTFATLTWRWTLYGKLPARLTRVTRTAGAEVKMWPYQLDDNDTSTMPAESNDDVVWDFGAERTVDWFRFWPRGDSGLNSRSKNLKIYGSHDGATWDKLYDQGGETPPTGWNRVAFASPVTYRYMKMADVEKINVCECTFWTHEAVVHAGRPKTWASDAIDSPEPAGGVEATLKLCFSTNASERLVAYAASEDYGDDRAAWAAHAAASYDCGQVLVGASATARFANLKAGRYCWKAFAINPSTGYAAPSSVATPFYAKSVGFNTKAYCPSGVATRVYDGVVSSFPDAGGWIVFDLSGLPSGYRLGAIRFWTRNDHIGSEYLAQFTMQLGYSDGTEDWQATPVQDCVRPLYTAPSNEPAGVTWGAESEVGDYVFHWYDHNDTSMEYLCDRKIARRHPRYLRLKTSAHLDLRELELRLVPTPGFVLLVR